MLNKPILFITFARPEYARKAFAPIKSIKPSKLYFYSNKARSGNQEEVRRNEEVRALVNEIDWDCEVRTWFRDEYVDVFTSIWGAIDWVFNSEQEAIVIEEDVVTCPAFFEYMAALLDRYRDEQKVWIISGDNAAPRYNPKHLSYFPTRFADIYGWASWADRWHSLDREMKQWPSFRGSKQFREYYNNWLERLIQKYYFDQVWKKRETYNPWDFVFNYNLALNKSYCIMPYVNLVADIGVSGANHSEGITSPLSTIMIHSESFPFSIGEPECIVPTTFDHIFFFNNRFLGLLKRKMQRLMHK